MRAGRAVGTVLAGVVVCLVVWGSPAWAVEGTWSSPSGDQAVGVPVTFTLGGIEGNDGWPYVCQLVDDGLVQYEGSIASGGLTFEHTFTLAHEGGVMVECSWDPFGGDNSIIVVVLGGEDEAAVAVAALADVVSVGLGLVVFLLAMHVVGTWGRG